MTTGLLCALGYFLLGMSMNLLLSAAVKWLRMLSRRPSVLGDYCLHVELEYFAWLGCLSTASYALVWICWPATIWAAFIQTMERT